MGCHMVTERLIFNGNKDYDGEFENGVRHGNGTSYVFNSNKQGYKYYEGEFENGSYMVTELTISKMAVGM